MLGKLAGVVADIRKLPADLLLIYANVSLYALCYQMQAPVQPELVKSLGEWNRFPQRIPQRRCGRH